MLSKEEIEKAKGWLSALDIKSEYEEISKEIMLQYIDQLEQENKSQNKIIDEMAEQLVGLHNLSEDDCFIPREYSDINDCARKISCIECIKQHFEKKVEKKLC